MSSIRDQIVDAIVTALNTGTPGGVPAASRSRVNSLETASLPAIVVRYAPGKEKVSQIGGRAGPLVQRNLFVTVECFAKGSSGTPAEKAADPLLCWASKALVGNKLGGLCHEIAEEETNWLYEVQDAEYTRADLIFSVQYHTKAADQTVKA